jgi:hypothetical protein
MRLAPGVSIIPYPSFRLGKRPGIVPPGVRMPLRSCSRSLAEEGSTALSLNVAGVKGLLSFHQRLGGRPIMAVYPLGFAIYFLTSK